MFTISLNEESAAVLLRCLAYGKEATSQAEGTSGVAQVMTDNINLIRDQICWELARVVIEETLHPLTGGTGGTKALGSTIRGGG